MKKLIPLSLLSLILVSHSNTYSGSSKSCCDCECRVQSRSTFVFRPQFQIGSPEYLTASRERMDAKEDGNGGSLQLTLFGGRSTKPGKLASYFTPDCKTCLRANSENTDGTTDLIAQHFNVNLQEQDGQETLFSSRISFCPRVKTIGLGIVYRHNLHQLLSDCYDPEERHAWFEISTPLTRIETTMGLSERITTSQTLEAEKVEELDQTFYSSMKAAFNQNAWCYGKINGCCECSETRLADITVMLGYETVKCDCCLIESYIGFLAPTGNRRCGHYVLEPIVGHAKHWGFVKGTNIIGKLWEDCEQERLLQVAMTIHGQYLFKKEEIRSFDLKNKPWSRYMEVYKNEAQAQEALNLQESSEEAAALLSTPGINVFTKCLCVRPKLSITSNTAFIYSGKRFKGEAGYNFYAKQSECVELCGWKQGPALKAARGQGKTNGLRTINIDRDESERDIKPCHDAFDTTEPFARYECNVIKACDIDLESATHPYFFSHTFYGSIGARWDDKKYPMYIDFGGSYEYGCENMVLNRWTAWAKLGASF